MPPISDKEKQQKQQEKYQAVLSGMLREEDNKYCVDCDSKGPRWASWNLGVFLCIRCAGIHRNLGVHISRVKSVNLDQWTAEQIASMQAMGNSKARAVYEANLPDNFRRSQTDSAMEQFIRAKYEQRKWIAKEWIPPNITISPDLTDDEKDKRKTKSSESNAVKLNLNMPSSSSASTSSSSAKKSSSGTKSSSSSSTVATKKAESTNAKAKTTNDLVNLFDLSDVATSLPNTNETSDANKPKQQQQQQANLLDDDLFANFNDSNIVQANSGTVVGNATANSNQNDLGSLIGDFGATNTNVSSSTNNNNSGKIDKSSILALYNNSSSSQNSAASQQQQQQSSQQQSSYQSQLNQLFTVPATSAVPSGASNMNFVGQSFTANPGIPMSNSQFNLGNKPFVQQQPQQQPQQKNQLFSDLNQLNNMNHMSNNKPMGAMFNSNPMQQQPQQAFQMNFNNNTNIPSSSSMFNLGASSSTSSQGANQMANFNLFANTNSAAASTNSAMPNIGNTMSSNLWQ